MKRSELREHIFRMVFSYEFNSDSEMPGQMQLYFEQMEDREPSEEDMEYIREKALAVILKTEEIDALINTHAKGWKTAINEAVELAKRYSGDDGPAFVNGVLAKLTETKGQQ